MSRHALLRYRAERLLRRDFPGLRPRVTAMVRSRLRASGVTLDAADLDACYAQAWHGLYLALSRGEQIEDLTAWLVLVTFRRAIDECRARGRLQAACEERGAERLADLAPAARTPDIAAELDDRDRLRQLLEALNGRLSPRERRAASLCYLQGLSRSQAAQRMGVSEARMRKLMDGSRGKPGVAAKMSVLLETIGAGGWCEQQGSLMRAYAFGILDPQGERHRLALVHLRECPACRAFVLSLRGLAAILPPLPLPPGAGHAHGRSTAASSGPTLTAKLVASGVVALGVGGGYALLAGGAPGHAARPAPASTTVSVPASPERAHLPFHHRRPHAARRARPLVSASPSASVSSSPPIVRLPRARSPLGEFTPERSPRAR
jgi:RNA polymerase sigma factor (sigma-70 family)